jgi:nuclear pore complex protein Nup188
MSAPFSQLRQRVLGSKAADGESIYLPSLEPCLRGDVLLLSWQDAYSNVSNFVTSHRSLRFKSSLAPTLHSGDDDSLFNFLVDPQVFKHLTNPFEPFSPPSGETNSLFDRLTSAINVTPDGGPYSIEQIKADALWLSDQAKISRSDALRVVVLEWQSRSRSRLLWTGGDEAKQSLEQQTETFQKSSFFAKPSMISDNQMLAERSDDGFTSEEERQFRLLRLFMSERLHVLRIAGLVIRHYLEYAAQGTSSPSKLYVIGETLHSIICKTDNIQTTSEPTRVENCIGDFTAALRQRLNKLEAGSGWYANQGGNESLERQWVQLQLDEMVPVLQLMFSVVTRVMPSSKATLAYFTLLSERNFFDFNPVSASSTKNNLIHDRISIKTQRHWSRF